MSKKSLIPRFVALLGVLFVFLSAGFFVAISGTRPTFLRSSVVVCLTNDVEHAFSNAQTSCSQSLSLSQTSPSSFPNAALSVQTAAVPLPNAAPVALQRQRAASAFAPTPSKAFPFPLQSFRSIPFQTTPFQEASFQSETDRTQPSRLQPEIKRSVRPVALNVNPQNVNQQTKRLLSQRKQFFQRLNLRTEDFRRFSACSGIDSIEAKFLIQNGWRKISNPLTETGKPATFADSRAEIDFLLETLSFFPDSASIRRARRFLQPASAALVWPSYSLSEQLRFAAVQFTEHSPSDDLVARSDLALLENWNRDSTLLLASDFLSHGLPTSPERPRVPLSFAFISSVSTLNRLAAPICESVLTETRNDGRVANARLSRITDFQKFHTLSAGRRPFLLI